MEDPRSRQEKNNQLLSVYLAKRLRDRHGSLFDALHNFGLCAKGSPPTIEVLASRLPTLFSALQEIGCSVQDGPDGEHVVIEQSEQSDNKEQSEFQNSTCSWSCGLSNSRASSVPAAQRPARPSSAPASRLRRGTQAKETTQDLKWPKAPFLLQPPQQTPDEQHKSCSRLSMPRHGLPKPPSVSGSATHKKHLSAMHAEAQMKSCTRLSAPLSRMQRASSEASLFQKTQPKTKIRAEEQDRLFQRLAQPRRVDHNVIDFGVFDDPEPESPVAFKRQVRPRSASQQTAACAYLAAPKNRCWRPLSPPKKCSVDSAAQRALSARLSAPRGCSVLRKYPISSSYSDEDGFSAASENLFSAWGAFDEEKAAIWAQQQAKILEHLEDNANKVAGAPPAQANGRRCPPVPRLPSLESLSGANNIYEHETFASDTCSSVSSSDTSDCGSAREDWTPTIPAQLPVRVLPISRPPCLSSPGVVDVITNSQGLVGWELARGCVHWA